MSAHVLLNLLNELGKRDKMRGLRHLLVHINQDISIHHLLEHQQVLCLA